MRFHFVAAARWLTRVGDKEYAIRDFTSWLLRVGRSWNKLWWFFKRIFSSPHIFTGLMLKVKTSLPVLLICAFLLAGCGQENAATTATPPVPAIAEALLGTWETVEVETTSNSYYGQDTTVYQKIMEADWKNTYGIKPARTVYSADGKLVRTYYNLAGEITDLTHGLWKAQGTDSLFIIEPNVTMQYKYELDGSRMILTGLVDWDFDGEQDDNYRAVLRLVARTEG
jgi:hypothetical protein